MSNASVESADPTPLLVKFQLPALAYKFAHLLLSVDAFAPAVMESPNVSSVIGSSLGLADGDALGLIDGLTLIE